MMLVYDAAQTLDIAGPVQLLSAAIDPATGAPAYEVELISEERGPVSTTCGLVLRVERSLDAVSAEAGFGAAERMRRAFIRHLGVTPGRYRERFRTAHRDPVTVPQTSGTPRSSSLAKDAHT